MEVNSLFSKLRPNYQLEHCITKRKQMNIIFFYASGQNLPWLKKTLKTVWSFDPNKHILNKLPIVT